MLLLTFSQPNFVERQNSYLATAMDAGYLFVVKSNDCQNLPRFEPELNQNIECSSNCNASRHNINPKLKPNRDKWYKSYRM